MIGKTVGHYEVVAKLGEGGMGEVFLAQDLTLDRRVALKVLTPALAADPDRRERFVREAKAIAALNHPNIVTVHSVEHDGDVYFLTMELVEGRTLGELIPAEGLPFDRLLGSAIPLADAVAAAHERGITHRDLKPANVMVTLLGRRRVPRVCVQQRDLERPPVRLRSGGRRHGRGRLLGHRGSRLIADLNVSPDGERLVYRAGLTQEDLFISQTDGTHEQQLTSDRARDRYPRWSPDGKRIAFYSDRTGPYEVWTIATDGGSLRKLSDSKDEVGLGYPFWSPDGTRIAGTDLRRFLVTIFDPNAPWSAQKLEQLPAPTGAGRFAAWSWSPDGRKISGNMNGVTVYDFATKTYRTVTSGAAAGALWLPDSRRIIFYSGNRVSLVDTATGATRIVLSTDSDEIRSLAISNDGRQLFLAQGVTESDIWVAKLK